jgi:uncharacterized protein YecT (DUF1311 family)
MSKNEFFLLLILLVNIVVVAVAEADIKTTSTVVEEDCEDSYYGLNGKVDYDKAFQCYEKQQDWPMLILLHLNGEGTPADVEKAEALLHAHQQDLSDDYIKEVKKAVDARKKAPSAKHSPLHFCNDLAFTNMEMDQCRRIDDLIAAAKFDTLHAGLNHKLSKTEASLLNKLVDAFEAFRQADADAVFNSLGGSPNYMSMFATEQSVALREHFQKLVEDIIEKRQLKATDEKTFKIADAELNRIYRDMIRNTDEIDAETPANYKKALKAAQLAWIKYRDTWADVVRLIYKDYPSINHPDVAIKTLVTQLRIKELDRGP